MIRVVQLKFAFLVLFAFSRLGMAQTTPAATSSPEAKPKIKLDHLVHDFKEVNPASDLEAVFNITNTGNAPLDIIDIKASCGCTIPSIGKRLLAPGETTVLKVRLKPPNIAGLVDKKVTIKTNDPVIPSVMLSLLANVVLELSIEPQFLRFENVLRSDQPTRDILLVPRDAEKFKVIGITADSPYLSTNLVQEGARYRVTVRLDAPSVPAGTSDFMSTLVHIKTNSESLPEALVPVNVRFLPLYTTLPERLQVYVKADATSTRPIIIKQTHGQPFEITAIRSSSPFVKPTIVTNGQASNDVSVSFEIPTGQRAASQGIITIEIGEKSIAVPFRVTVENPQPPTTGQTPAPENPAK